MASGQSGGQPDVAAGGGGDDEGGMDYELEMDDGIGLIDAGGENPLEKAVHRSKDEFVNGIFLSFFFPLQWRMFYIHVLEKREKEIWKESESRCGKRRRQEEDKEWIFLLWVCVGWREYISSNSFFLLFLCSFDGWFVL